MTRRHHPPGSTPAVPSLSAGPAAGLLLQIREKPKTPEDMAINHLVWLFCKEDQRGKNAILLSLRCQHALKLKKRTTPMPPSDITDKAIEEQQDMLIDIDKRQSLLTEFEAEHIEHIRPTIEAAQLLEETDSEILERIWNRLTS